MGFWSGVGNFLKKAAPIGVSFIPGVGPVAGALLAGGISAAGGALQGRGAGGSIIDGLMGAAGGAAGRGVGGRLASAGGNLIRGLMHPDTLQEIGTGASSIAKKQAHNRGVELDAMIAADDQRMKQDQERREDENHLWRMIQAANYIKSGGKPPSGPQKSASGRTIPQFSFGPSAISDADKAMASTLEEQLTQRLQNPPKLRDYDSTFKPGTVESILNWAGPIANTASSFVRNRPQAADPISLELPDSIFAPDNNPVREPFRNIEFDPEVATPRNSAGNFSNLPNVTF